MMKGKTYTTEDKIRILREVDRGGKSIQTVCQEQNISEVSSHRWRRQFGHMEINEAHRLKELERESREPKRPDSFFFTTFKVIGFSAPIGRRPQAGVCYELHHHLPIFSIALRLRDWTGRL